MLTDHGLYTSLLRGFKIEKNRSDRIRQKVQNFCFSGRLFRAKRPRSLWISEHKGFCQGWWSPEAVPLGRDRRKSCGPDSPCLGLDPNGKSKQTPWGQSLELLLPREEKLGEEHLKEQKKGKDLASRKEKSAKDPSQPPYSLCPELKPLLFIGTAVEPKKMSRGGPRGRVLSGHWAKLNVYPRHLRTPQGTLVSCAPEQVVRG